MKSFLFFLPLFFPLQAAESNTSGLPTSLTHATPVTAMSWKSDGTQLVTASSDAQIQIWDIDTKKETGKLTSPYLGLFSLDWNPFQDIVAGGGPLGTLCIWNIHKNNPINTWPTTAAIFSVCWNYTGKFLASGGCDKKVRVLDPKRPDRVHEFSYSSDVYAVSCNPIYNLIASALQGSIKVRDMQSHAITHTLNESVQKPSSLCWSSNGQLLGVASNGQKNAQFDCWDTRNTQAPLFTFEVPHSYLNSSSWNSEGYIAIGGADQSIYIIDSKRGKCVKKRHHNEEKITPGGPLQALISASTWRPQHSQILATASSVDTSVRIRDESRVPRS